MDPAVAMVRAYLQANGYFTATEVPVLEALKGGHIRTATDLDVLAVRFPGSRGIMPRRGRKDMELHTEDPELEHEPDRIEFIIGEVKEGKAVLNAAATQMRVLRAALKRFGAFDESEIRRMVDELIATGETHTEKPESRVRLMAFGSAPPDHPGRYEVITLDQILAYFRRVMIEYKELLPQFQTKDPFLGTLVVLAKAGVYDLSHDRSE